MPIGAFLAADPNAILGQLTRASKHDVELEQRGAWLDSVALLKSALVGIDGYLYLEFDVPRLGSRIDAVIITGHVIFPIEFKVGEHHYPRSAVNQAWDYALDLKNFHHASHDAPILPILVATAAVSADTTWQPPSSDRVRPPFCCDPAGLAPAIRGGLTLKSGTVIDGEAWGRSPYHPTPTIIEAAQALYSQHSVDAISRSDAGARNLAITAKKVEEVIDHARRTSTKAIVFVTGVPGAGKTLVGLNVATARRDETSATHAVFLSGNGPLVAVLRAALVRDEIARQRGLGKPVRKGKAEQPIKQFIQNVHHFRDEGIRDPNHAPSDHVAIFDEAQRAWDQKATSNFMRRRKGVADFDQSEPQFLIGYMDRHEDWAVIVCLVGGGQEINIGEAGIATWLDTLRDHYPHWQIYISPRLADNEYAAIASIDSFPSTTSVRRDADLHLAVSMRSFRSERVSDFVKVMLDLDTAGAQKLFHQVSSEYPIALTRDLDRAKAWVRAKARGTERYGLVASSQAMRLKPHGIDVRVKTDPVHWFLNDAAETRSSYYLEDPATEFQIQGLELDWVCVTWDADLRCSRTGWKHFRFRGDMWQQRRHDASQRYLVNAYRVLLTRARQGMVIFVPPGNEQDPTRLPALYDDTFRYLAEVGIPILG